MISRMAIDLSAFEIVIFLPNSYSRLFFSGFSIIDFLWFNFAAAYISWLLLIKNPSMAFFCIEGFLLHACSINEMIKICKLLIIFFDTVFLNNHLIVFRCTVKCSCGYNILSTPLRNILFSNLPLALFLAQRIFSNSSPPMFL